MAVPFDSCPMPVNRWLSSELFEQAPISISVLDRELQVVFSNNNFIAVFGDPAGRSCYEVYKKRDRPCEDCVALKTFRDGVSRIGEEEGLDCIGNQASYVVHHSPITDNRGAIAYVVNMSYDVTDRRSFQEQYNLLFEHVPCSLSVINRDLRITRANAHARERFGDAVGSHCFEAYKRRAAPCSECPARDSFVDGAPHTSRQVRMASDGTYTYHVVSCAPLPSERNGASHVVEMALDVTDVHVLSKELAARERMATVGQTVTQLAHSIKNILTGLQGGIYDIKVGVDRDLGDRTREGLQTLERSFGRINGLVREFLRFSKEHRPELEPCDVNALAREVFALFRKVAERNSISLELSLLDEPPAIELDPDAIHTALANLMSNAMDACIAAERPDTSIRMLVEQDRSWLLLRVSDTGCGMDRATQDRLFGGIFTTKGAWGSGLGLMMTKKIVEDHGGRVLVESTPGRGSTFTLRLPLELDRAADEIPTAPDEQTEA